MSKTLGEQIKEARLAIGLTQRQLAERSGLNFTTICYLERDHERVSNPTAYIIRTLQKVLNVKFDIWD